MPSTLLVGQKKILANAFLFVLSILITACQENHGSVSTEGMAQCRSKDALNSNLGMAPLQRKSAFRQCLQTIDAKIKAQRLQAKTNATEATQLLQESQPHISVTDIGTIIKFCSANKGLIAGKLKRYNEITGEVSRKAYMNPESEELDRLEVQQQSIAKELYELVPVSYRIGLPLLPDAASLLMRCDQQEILVILEKQAMDTQESLSQP